MITVTNEDNMQLMSRYPDDHFDLAIVDLEYCIGASKPTTKNKKVKQKNGSTLNIKQTEHTAKEWDFKLSSPEYLLELFRVSKRQIIFGGNYYGLAGGYLIWDKLNGESDQFGCEMAWVSDSKRTDIFYYLWRGMFQGIYAGKDIKKAHTQQGDKSKNEIRIHPTQKPIPVYKYILQNYAKKGDLILDTHLGSGSIAIACNDLGFDLVACELDKEYFDAYTQRFEEYLKEYNELQKQQSIIF